MAPSLDLDLVQQLGRDIHSHGNSINSVMSEEEVCPWTLFLTLTLTLLKGSLPYIPKVSQTEAFFPLWKNVKGGQIKQGILCVLAT